MKTVSYFLFSLFTLLLVKISFFPEKLANAFQDENSFVAGSISGTLGLVFLLLNKNKTTS